MAATETKRHELQRTASRLKRRFYVACGIHPALDRAVLGPQAASLRSPNPNVAHRLRDSSLRSEWGVFLGIACIARTTAILFARALSVDKFLWRVRDTLAAITSG